jgi:hypothetical protein
LIERALILSEERIAVIEDKSKAACPLIAPIRLLRSVAKKSVPRNSNILGGDSFTREGCDQLAGQREPLCGGSGLLC